MNPMLFLVALTLALAGCGADASLSTFTLADGTVYSDTDCHVADHLLIGGYAAADGLPVKGQTDRARVEAEFEAVRDHLGTKVGVQAIRVVPRNGEVWSRLPGGDHVVELVEDFQYEVVLGRDGVCPSAPYSVNGIPVIYNRTDG